MSTLLAHPTVFQDVSVAEPRRPFWFRAKRSPAGVVATTHVQVMDHLRDAGLRKSDMAIFAIVYVVALGLGALICLMGRAEHELAWRWGQQLMNVPLASLGLGLLMIAAGLGCVALIQVSRSRRGPAVVFAVLAAVGYLAFIATTAIDLNAKWVNGVRAGDAFRPGARYVAGKYGVRLPRVRKSAEPALAADLFAAKAPRTISAAHGAQLFAGTCTTCHGPAGEGMPGQGKNLHHNEFVGANDDASMFKFLTVGRAPWDPANTTKVQMPPRGGNPMLSDDDLRDIVAYLRSWQEPATSAASVENPPQTSNLSIAGDQPSEAAPPPLFIQRWVVSPPAIGPAGVTREFAQDCNRRMWETPRDGVQFANAYYLANGFTGLHALALAGLFVGVAVQMRRGRIHAERRGPLALALAGSVGLALFWALIFPFVYLM